MERLASERGQSLIEALVGVALGALFIIGTVALISPALRTNTQVAQVQARAQLASELLENVTSWSSGNWNAVLGIATGTANTYYLITTTSSFAVATGTESIVINAQTYSRYFYLGDVYRTSNGYTTTTASGNNYDPSTKFVTVVVAAQSTSSPATTTVNSYITRRSDDVFNQTSWAGGGSQSGALTMTSTTFATSSGVSINASGSIQLTSAGGSSCVQ